MSEYENNNIAMSWDDTIENDGGEYTLLPEGDYDFEVVDFTRGRFEGSDNLTACPQAELSIKLFDRKNPGIGSTTVKHFIKLNKKLEWLICQFFTSIGDRKHGEALKPNWTAIKGKGGRCKVGIRTWTKKDGSEGKSNEIQKFYEPEETAPASAAPQRTFVPGKF